MALAALLKAILGAADMWATATGSAVVDIAVLLSKSDLSRSINSARGRSRSSLAIRTRGAISASIPATGVLGEASRLVIARSSLSNRERLGIGTLHICTKFLKGAELQLLDGALGTLQFQGYFTNALLFRKTHDDYAALVLWKPVDELEQCGLSFDAFHIR